ncbi:hypothetical protein GOBAR_AA36841 [Gossypium barbadense]|uniref:Uncharacterized protein n=1 Tax=Gossypium barbadense TaxID=3634 RepID=A0A2P5VYF5_GOSBA|nr:hypothetical protein GOBAR_AA36841 [Gossypium barbadense]
MSWTTSKPTTKHTLILVTPFIRADFCSRRLGVSARARLPLSALARHGRARERIWCLRGAGGMSRHVFPSSLCAVCASGFGPGGAEEGGWAATGRARTGRCRVDHCQPWSVRWWTFEGGANPAFFMSFRVTAGKRQLTRQHMFGGVPKQCCKNLWQRSLHDATVPDGQLNAINRTAQRRKQDNT